MKIFLGIKKLMKIMKFVLKGGMNFYSVYYKFLTTYGQSFPDLKDYLLEIVKDNKRSDYDFTILIDPELDDDIYYKIYYLVNKEISKKCIFYQMILEKNLNIILNMDKTVVKIKEEINKQFDKNNKNFKILICTIQYFYGKKKLKSDSNLPLSN